MGTPRYTEEFKGLGGPAGAGSWVQDVGGRTAAGHQSSYSLYQWGKHWRQHYNNVRPHSSLGDLTPNEFVRKIRSEEDSGAILQE